MNYPKKIDIALEKVKEITSTNDYLAHLCKESKAKEFYTVMAESQTKGKGQNFVGYVVSKHIAFLNGADHTFLCHAKIEYLHNHEKTTPQPRYFRTHNHVSFLYLV